VFVFKFGERTAICAVMAGLVPAIHVFLIQFSSQPISGHPREGGDPAIAALTRPHGEERSKVARLERWAAFSLETYSSRQFKVPEIAFLP
jgi:hypothetical protein